MGEGAAWVRRVERVGAWLLATNLWVAGGLALGLVASGHVLHVDVSGRTIALGFATALFVYNLDHLRDAGAFEVGGRRASRAWIGTITILAGLASAVLLVAAHHSVQLVCAAYAGLGVAYGATMRGFQLKRVAGLKSWLVATSSAIAGTGLVVADGGRALDGDVVLVAAVAFAMIAVNAHLCDIVDYADDRAHGVRTLPVMIGVPKTRSVLRAILVACAACQLAGTAAHLFSPHYEILVFLAVNYALTYFVRPEISGVWGYLVVDGTLYLVPLAGIAHRVIA